MNIKPSSYTSRIGTHLAIRFRRDDQGPTAYLSEIPMSGNAQNKRQFPSKRN